MNILKKYNLTPWIIAKIALVVVLGFILLVFLGSIMQTSFRSLRGGNSSYQTDSSIGFVGGMPMYEESFYEKEVALSQRNIVPVPPMDGTSGNDAEEFEVTEYNVSIETRNKNSTCPTIEELKSKSYVIFESTNNYEKGCNFTFKVEKENSEEILAILHDFEPKDLSVNTYTIKNRVEDFTSEIDILNKKKTSIEQTLEDAIKAYEEITSLATGNRDAETLAKIIDSKISTIEKLTQERIEVNEQLDRLERSKAEQLDRLEYTYFYVNVYENKYIDGEEIKDSWKLAVQDFVYDLNNILQNLSVGLVVLLLLLLQYVIYLAIIVFISKFVWKYVKRFWKW